MNIYIRYLAMVAFVSSLCTFQATFGAELDVYNDTGVPISVKVFYGKTNPQYQEAIIQADGEYHFSSNIHNFIGIRWISLASSECYEHTNIPSARSMTMGSVKIRPKGRLSVNFNENGLTDNISDKVATPCKG